MSNQDTTSAMVYHESTKLNYINLDNKPSLYKSYPSGPVIKLPSDLTYPEGSTLAALEPPNVGGGGALDLKTLAQLLFLSAGVIRKANVPSAGEVHYRAAASAGALYPIETYVVCRDIPGIEAGVYHFAPLEFSLSLLRRGDFRAELASASGGDESIAHAPVSFVYSSVFWRSAWKYRIRGYRYCFWDNGTIIANLLSAATSSGLSARIVTGFVDERVDRLVGIDGQQEGAMCIAPVGHVEETSLVSGSPYIPDISCQYAFSYPDQVDYPEINQAHGSGSLTSESQVTAWRGESPAPLQAKQEVYYPIKPTVSMRSSSASLGDVLLKRGSTRRFDRQAISIDAFNCVFHAATAGVPADFLGHNASSLLDIYMIVNAVEGIPPGAYVISPQRRDLELLEQGDFREEAGHLGFEQALPADSSVAVFFMADLARILTRYGNRGYRAAQLEAGILGGKIYLATHALGLGATGLTFYDEDVTEFFSPHASGKSVMFVVALGVTSGQNRVRPFRSRVAVRLDARARGAGQASA